MPRPSYPILCVCAVAALLSALAAWENATGGLSNGPLCDLLFPNVRDAKDRRRQIEAEVAAEQARRRQLDELTRAVEAGRVSLLEGAGRLRELYRGEPPSVWFNVCRRFPNASDEERYCRLLIGEVEAHAQVADRARAPALVAGLEAELREHIRHGTLRLPEGGRPAGLGTMTIPLSSGKSAP